MNKYGKYKFLKWMIEMSYKYMNQIENIYKHITMVDLVSVHNNIILIILHYYAIIKIDFIFQIMKPAKNIVVTGGNSGVGL